MNKKPIIAITMSEAAGIGPEVLLKSLKSPEVLGCCTPVVIGEAWIMEKAAKAFGVDVPFHVIQSFDEAVWDDEKINLIDINDIPEEKLVYGQPNAYTGRSMLDQTRCAVQLFLDGKIDGAVGGPHSKAAAEEAGEYFDGYPSLIAKMTGSDHPFLMLTSNDDKNIRVACVSNHVSLKNAIAMLTPELVLSCIVETNKAVKSFAIEKPHIAVAALNPHAGENRMFGDEDLDIIKPAIEQAKELGIDVSGPYPPDSLFYRCDTGKFDAYIAMYHDQGHLPVKVIAFKSTSAVSIGVPVNWATVDHGCALDIAWTGVADPNVMIGTIQLISRRAATFRNIH